jgi:hypothetical protein
MSFVFVAPGCRGLVGLPGARHPGAAVPIVRDHVEYVFHTRQVPWLLASVAMDVVPALRPVVAARRLVPILKTESIILLQSLKPVLSRLSP